jgi:NAD(P)H dehydrogenase (quinone)
MPTRLAARSQHHIVLANPTAGSFDHAVAVAYAEEIRSGGGLARIRDLNAMAFDPVLKDEDRPDRGGKVPPWISAELDLISESDVIVFIYPIWFGGPPAILKGYVDRVLGSGMDFRRFRDGAGAPGLRGRFLLTISSSGLPQEWLEGQGQARALREGWDVYLERGFGLRDGGHLSLDGIIRHMSPEHAGAALERVRGLARGMCDKLARSADGGTAPAADDGLTDCT